MNFPDTVFFSLLYTLINTPAIGGIVVALLGGGVVLSVAFTLRWIIQGGEVDELDVYAYPTPALHAHKEE